MSTPSSPGPEDRDKRDALSPWERRVLEGIEHDLAASDPRLAHELGRRAPKAGRRWGPFSARSIGLLLVALVVLVVAGALLPASWWAVLGLVTLLVVVPWLLFAASERDTAN
jgi:Flp pilus assembly protein TadB